MQYLIHSAKGTTWKNHKYIKKENGKYIYASRASSTAKKIVKSNEDRRHAPNVTSERIKAVSSSTISDLKRGDLQSAIERNKKLLSEMIASKGNYIDTHNVRTGRNISRLDYRHDLNQKRTTKASSPTKPIQYKSKDKTKRKYSYFQSSPLQEKKARENQRKRNRKTSRNVY